MIKTLEQLYGARKDDMQVCFELAEYPFFLRYIFDGSELSIRVLNKTFHRILMRYLEDENNRPREKLAAVLTGLLGKGSSNLVCDTDLQKLDFTENCHIHLPMPNATLMARRLGSGLVIAPVVDERNHECHEALMKVLKQMAEQYEIMPLYKSISVHVKDSPRRIPGDDNDHYSFNVGKRMSLLSDQIYSLKLFAFEDITNRMANSFTSQFPGDSHAQIGTYYGLPVYCRLAFMSSDGTEMTDRNWRLGTFSGVSGDQELIFRDFQQRKMNMIYYVKMFAEPKFWALSGAAGVHQIGFENEQSLMIEAIRNIHAAWLEISFQNMAAINESNLRLNYPEQTTKP